MVFVCLALLGIHLVYYFATPAAARFVAAVPLLFFLPGYVLVGVLFPRMESRNQGTRLGGVRALAHARQLDRVTFAERIGFSFGLSVALLPFFAFALYTLSIDPFDGAILPTLTAFVLVGAVLAAIRRLQVPIDERFSLPVERATSVAHGSIFGPISRTERLTNIALAVSILFAATMIGYAFAVPQDGEQFTDFRLMTENADGELALNGYPSEIVAGEGADFVIGIDNREGSATDYTVVVTAERIVESDGEIEVIDSQELDRFDVSADAGERTTQPHTVDPEATGEFRINYYLYRGGAPSEPDAESAYRHIHITVEVVESAA